MYEQSLNIVKSTVIQIGLKIMTTNKRNNIEKATNHGSQTINDILAILRKHTDLDKLSGKQIGEIINAMYESNRIGYNKCGEEFSCW